MLQRARGLGFEHVPGSFGAQKPRMPAGTAGLCTINTVPSQCICGSVDLWPCLPVCPVAPSSLTGGPLRGRHEQEKTCTIKAMLTLEHFISEMSSAFVLLLMLLLQFQLFPSQARGFPYFSSAYVELYALIDIPFPVLLS